jgi:hypothetical protein
MKDRKPKPKPLTLAHQADLEAILRQKLLARAKEIAQSIEARVRKLNQDNFDQIGHEPLPVS